MAAASPSAAWVWGFRNGTGRNSGRVVPTIGSWDGTRWRFDHIPTLPGQPWLRDVAALSATDAWAVGGRWVKGKVPHGIQSVIWHWNGRSWKVVPSPKIGHPTRFVRSPKKSWLQGERVPSSGDQLDAIAAVSANNIWAVGVYDELLRHHKPWGGYVSKLLTEHWNGKKWTVASSRPALPFWWQDDSPKAAEEILTSVAAAPLGAVLGLAEFDVSQPGYGRPVWWFNRSTWRRDHSLKRSYQPTAITITSQQDAWVFGHYFPLGGSSNPVPAAHWDGNQWLPSNLPAKGSVYSAAASASDNVWVAGNLRPTNGKSKRNEMLHYTC
jgi:hypothetical protein